MRIKDLPKDLQKLALDNQHKQNRIFDGDEWIVTAFTWEVSPEGHDFWSRVEQGENPLQINNSKPTQYKIGIDTFERAKANLTKEELLACCRFNIDKYTWRKKDQDKSDFEKIIAYANYAIENGF